MQLQFSYMAKKTLTDKTFQKARGIDSPLRKRLFTLKEAAVYLGRSEWSMRNLAWSHKIPVVKEEEGRKIYFDIVDLDKYISNHKAAYV